MSDNGDAFFGKLLPQERVLWSGRPAQGLLFTSRDAYLIPFSLLWGGFVIFWEASVLRTNAPTFMALFGIPFVLVGIFMIFGRFWLDASLRAMTDYAVTNQRILTNRRGRRPTFKALRIDNLPEATLLENKNGRGTIRFGPQASLFAGNYGNGFSSWVPSLDPVQQFLEIADVQRVFTLIQRRSYSEKTGA